MLRLKSEVATLSPGVLLIIVSVVIFSSSVPVVFCLLATWTIGNGLTDGPHTSPGCNVSLSCDSLQIGQNPLSQFCSWKDLFMLYGIYICYMLCYMGFMLYGLFMGLTHLLGITIYCGGFSFHDITELSIWYLMILCLMLKLSIHWSDFYKAWKVFIM